MNMVDKISTFLETRSGHSFPLPKIFLSFLLVCSLVPTQLEGFKQFFLKRFRNALGKMVFAAR